MSFNKIILVGNLGRDPELRYTPNGNAVCNISVATSEKKRDKAGDLQDITTWFRVTLWGKQAENASKYLTKGNPVYIEGRLRVEEWTDKENNNRYTLEVTATDMHFLSGGGQSGDSYSDSDYDSSGSGNDFSSSNTSSADENSNSEPLNDDDIPF